MMDYMDYIFHAAVRVLLIIFNLHLLKSQQSDDVKVPFHLVIGYAKFKILFLDAIFSCQILNQYCY